MTPSGKVIHYCMNNSYKSWSLYHPYWERHGKNVLFLSLIKWFRQKFLWNLWTNFCTQVFRFQTKSKENNFFDGQPLLSCVGPENQHAVSAIVLCSQCGHLPQQFTEMYLQCFVKYLDIYNHRGYFWAHVYVQHIFFVLCVLLPWTPKKKNPSNLPNFHDAFSVEETFVGENGPKLLRTFVTHSASSEIVFFS